MSASVPTEGEVAMIGALDIVVLGGVAAAAVWWFFFRSKPDELPDVRKLTVK